MLALTGTLLFSIKPVFVKLAFQYGGDAVSIMTLRAMSSFSSLQLNTMNEELVTIGVLLGIFCTVIPSYLIAAIMARLDPAHLTLVSNIGHAMTALYAIFILNESFTWVHALGMLLTVFLVVMINRFKS